LATSPASPRFSTNQKMGSGESIQPPLASREERIAYNQAWCHFLITDSKGSVRLD
jgi:hypothetical protein